MINAIVGIAIFFILFWGAQGLMYLVSIAHKPKIEAKKPPLPINYWKIARLELDLFGETRPNVDSPVPAYCKTMAEVNGISDSGHTKDGTCNVNAQLGPVCEKKITHYARYTARDKITERRVTLPKVRSWGAPTPQRCENYMLMGIVATTILIAVTGQTKTASRGRLR